MDAYAVAEDVLGQDHVHVRAHRRQHAPRLRHRVQGGPVHRGRPGQYTVETLGSEFLYITFKPVSQYDDTRGRRKQTYLGNLRLRLQDMHHTEIVRKLIDGPDGTQSWVIGLDSRSARSPSTRGDSVRRACHRLHHAVTARR